ncbi:aspartic protease 9, partial [Aphelenchoides avenae]
CSARIFVRRAAATGRGLPKALSRARRLRRITRMVPPTTYSLTIYKDSTELIKFRYVIDDKSVEYVRLQVGDLSVGRAYFGQTTLLNPYFDYVPADGVLGLAYHLSYIGEDAVKPFIQQLIESGALGEPVFTVYMSNKKDLEVAGTITYGDFDDDRCERPAIYAHIGVGYDFKAGYVKIGSTLLQPVNATSVTITTFFTDDYVIVPVEHIDAVVDAFGAVYNRTSGEITVQCDAKLPSIGISLGGQQLAVSSDALISDKPSVDG